MADKKAVPFSRETIEAVLEREKVGNQSKPVYLYDAQGIEADAERFCQAFSWVPAEVGGFRNYFALKSTPPTLMAAFLKKLGMGLDCSSLAELVSAHAAGFSEDEIMFTSNDTPAIEFQTARKIGAIINLDDITHIDFLEIHAGIPDRISFRINPGYLKAGNDIIGEPTKAKYGITVDQITGAYQEMKRRGVNKFGMHTMVVSNELKEEYFVDTARLLFRFMRDVSKELEIKFDFVNLGGGIGIPYRPGEEAVDIAQISDGIHQEYKNIIILSGLDPLRVTMECGRFVTGPHGYLVTTVRHVMEKYRNYVGVDASMADLMRPGMYSAYHHITVLGKEDLPQDYIYDVVGSLCENNDKFAEQRNLPKIEPDDILIIHDAGAHGRAMGFNYNGKLRCGEYIVNKDGTYFMIRRREKLEDYFATMEGFEGAVDHARAIKELGLEGY